MRKAENLVYPIYFGDRIIRWSYYFDLERSTHICQGIGFINPSDKFLFNFTLNRPWQCFTYARAIEEKMRNDHFRA